MTVITTQRKIIHVDMDAFYASVEQRDFPEYKGLPLVVGGQPDSRGVVATCSYEARRFGIHSAMPCSRAYRLCPQAVFVRPRFEAYQAVSTQLHAIFRSYTALIEPLSLDEAYLDVSLCQQHQGSATRIAEAIRADIVEQTGLTASAGVSYNKFLAKLASDMDKPNGLTVILPGQAIEVLHGLPIGDFYGIGKATERRMHRLGIRTGEDLSKRTLTQLQLEFGKAGAWYYQVVRGIDERLVRVSRQRKSLGTETTLAEDLANRDTMLEILEQLAEKVVQKLRSKKLDGRTLTLKVKYSNFEQVTRSISVTHSLADVSKMKQHLVVLLARTEAGGRPVRLLGLTVSGFTEKDVNLQRQLFEGP